MYKLRGLLLKNGVLERVPSLPPIDRVASLVDDDCKLTPLSASFWDMDPPTGVFTRAYEDVHYLDKFLDRANSAHALRNLEASFGLGLNGTSGTAANALQQLDEQHPFQSITLGSSALNGVAQAHISAESLRDIALSQANTKGTESLYQSAINAGLFGGTENQKVKTGIWGGLDPSTIEASVLGDLNSSAIAAGTLWNQDSIAKATDMLGNQDSIAKATSMLVNQDTIAKAADMMGGLGSSAKAAGMTDHSSFIHSNHTNPYEDLLNQVPKIPKFENREASLSNLMDGHAKHIREEKERQAEQQNARDELQREQAELSAKHLQLNAEQFEESKRVRAKQDRTEKYLLWLTVFVAIVTTIGLFFETQEVRSLLSDAGHQIFDLAVSAKNSIAVLVSSIFEKDT